jgi:3-oxoacyl-[acyl-carrier-protein] synthase II
MAPAIDLNPADSQTFRPAPDGTWQRLGTYTAGLALDDAGVKADEAICART